MTLMLLSVLTLATPGDGYTQGGGTDGQPGRSPRLRGVEVERIHLGDILEVDVLGSLEDDWVGGLNPEGELVGFPLLPEGVQALCKSPLELAEELRGLLGQFLREPRIAVRIVDKSGRATASIAGGVRVPQRFSIRRSVTLRELLVVAGGLTEDANGSVTVYRPGRLACTVGTASESSEASSPGELFETSISEMLRQGDGEAIEIGSGDVVTVLESLPVFIVGGVTNPGRYASRTEMTVARLVAAAGGLLPRAKGTGIRVFRSGPEGGEVIDVDLDKIAAGTSRDVVLRPFDVVEIPDKRRGKATARPFIDMTRAGSGSVAPGPVRIID